MKFKEQGLEDGSGAKSVGHRTEDLRASKRSSRTWADGTPGKGNERRSFDETIVEGLAA